MKNNKFHQNWNMLVSISLIIIVLAILVRSYNLYKDLSPYFNKIQTINISFREELENPSDSNNQKISLAIESFYDDADIRGINLPIQEVYFDYSA